MKFTPRRPSFKHQSDGLRRLIENDGTFALLWEPGTGKTKTVIDYLSWLCLSAKSEVRVLVVCPKAVTDSWVEQTMEFAHEDCRISARVLEGSINDKITSLGEKATFSHPTIVMKVVNLEALSSRRGMKKSQTQLHSDGFVNAVKKWKPHVLVVDESHRIKGNSSNTSRLLRRMSKHIDRRILLTGTPMPHGPLDVWAQWQVLDSGAFATAGKPWSFALYKQRYSVLGGWAGREVVEYRNLDDLEDRMASRSMVVKKSDALDLPPTTDVIRWFDLEPREQKAYDRMVNDLLIQFSDGSVSAAPSRLTQMLRLRQITSGYVVPDLGAPAFIGESRLNATMDLLEDLMATEKRVVVFSWGRPEIDRLVDKINASKALNGAKAEAITGDTPDPERLAIRKKFASSDEKPLIVVAQWRTVSLGVNEFVTASHAIFLSLSQQRDDLIQGKGRLDRQGQTRAVTFWFVQARNTVDEVILNSHRDRTDLEDSLLSHIRGGRNGNQ